MKAPMSEVINELSDYCLEMDSEAIHIKEYTPEDIMNITLIFSHVISNYNFANIWNKTIEELWDNATASGEDLHQYILKYTWINT